MLLSMVSNALFVPSSSTKLYLAGLGLLYMHLHAPRCAYMQLHAPMCAYLHLHAPLTQVSRSTAEITYDHHCYEGGAYWGYNWRCVYPPAC